MRLILMLILTFFIFCSCDLKQNNEQKLIQSKLDEYVSNKHPEYIKFRKKFKVIEKYNMIIIASYDERPAPGTILAGKELEESKKVKDPVCDPSVILDVLNIVSPMSAGKEVIYGYSFNL